VIPIEDFSQGVDGVLAELASRSASAVSLGKRLLYQIDGVSFEAAIRTGAQVNALARLTEDCQTGIGEFLARRTRRSAPVPMTSGREIARRERTTTGERGRSCPDALDRIQGNAG
jgi:hypothetical protein